MDDKFASLYLDKQLCFPLYAASRLTTKLYGPYLDKLDITYPQYLVMLVLWQHNSQTVNKIGQRLMLESNTLTPLLKRLEAKGLLSRKRAEIDERTVIVALTKKGDDLKAAAASIPEQIFSSFQDESVSIAEITIFKDMLEKLINSLDEKVNKAK
ncbi:DNA-binding transcriptional regulator, MarR family [Marivirga sericea]|uniref:DNA-binding transcriptional regulator, MarR family n=1 Tax=Marivirga sericea TaxID=1028 RepID=A0A1X7IB54_9BACT|nr:MarR family transcriptional regulator [Marivirga sericea]SMG11903.1 DNA-binding transcriptional regulator, MarR family [Marivirga sericea]